MSPPAADHATHVRVRYCESDPMGVAHHASYFPWLEIARTDALRQTGTTYATLETEGVFLVIADASAKFRRPARYDDVIEIIVRVRRATRAKLQHSYEIRLVEAGGHASAEQELAPGELLVTAETTLACVDARGSVRPLPEGLLGALASQEHASA
ncbi:MAG: thioesterase family protein [Planctomycetota bacterium]